MIDDATLEELQAWQDAINKAESSLAKLGDSFGLLARRNRVTLYFWDEDYQKLRKVEGTLKKIHSFSDGRKSLTFEIGYCTYDDGDFEYYDATVGVNAFYSIEEARDTLSKEFDRRIKMAERLRQDKMLYLQEAVELGRVW